MSRPTVLVSLTLVAASLHGPAGVALVPQACAPEGPMDVARPAGCTRTLYRYGPLAITPGDNLILFGPVTIEKPVVNGSVVRFRPDLTLADGSVPPIERIHLHHAVWFSTAYGDPLFASGEEKTIFSMPNGYGIRTRATGETWLLNYMVHNQTAEPYTVFITYELDVIPDTAGVALTAVEPYWIDVGGFNGFNPVYNTQRGFGARPGECSFPRERCAAFDPYGATGSREVGGNGAGHSVDPPDGTIVWMLGHLHPGGLRLELDQIRGSDRRRVFTSRARYFDPGGPLSWDMSMEVTRPDYRLRIASGDRLVLNSVYDTAHGSWYEGMGIVISFIARGDPSGPDPFATDVDPDNVGITHGHMAEASNHGGPGRNRWEFGERVDTDRVGIAGFAYLPGNIGVPAVASIPRGEVLEFWNMEPAGQVFHTVTSCVLPCDGPTGISYPIADGPVDFDSLQLGYGPPGATAASNTIRFGLDTSQMSPGMYTYFCRVHPFMRGAFEVRAAA